RAHRMVEHGLARRRSRLANRFEPVAADAAREGRPAVCTLDQPAIATGIWNQRDRIRRELAAGEMRLEAEEIRRFRSRIALPGAAGANDRLAVDIACLACQPRAVAHGGIEQHRVEAFALERARISIAGHRRLERTVARPHRDAPDFGACRGVEFFTEAELTEQRNAR